MGGGEGRAPANGEEGSEWGKKSIPIKQMRKKSPTEGVLGGGDHKKNGRSPTTHHTDPPQKKFT